MENLIKMDDLEVPLFLETPISLGFSENPQEHGTPLWIRIPKDMGIVWETSHCQGVP